MSGTVEESVVAVLEEFVGTADMDTCTEVENCG